MVRGRGLRAVEGHRSPRLPGPNKSQRLRGSGITRASGPSPYLLPLLGGKKPVGSGKMAPAKLDSLQGAAIIHLSQYQREFSKHAYSSGRPKDALDLTNSLDGIRGRHFILVGGTCHMGEALSAALIPRIGLAGSLLVLSDQDPSDVTLGEKAVFPYYYGEQLQKEAQARGLRYTWINQVQEERGGADPVFSKIKEHLRDCQAQNLVIIHTLEPRSFGVMPGHDPFYIREVDDGNRLFEWQIPPLTFSEFEKARIKFVSVPRTFSELLVVQGFKVASTHFVDYWASEDEYSREPRRVEYGRQGIFSGHLSDLKQMIREHVLRKASDRNQMVHVLPSSSLRSFFGGNALANLYQNLMQAQGIRFIDVPELALMVLDRIRLLHENSRTYTPVVRHDEHERILDKKAMKYLAEITATRYNLLKYPG